MQAFTVRHVSSAGAKEVEQRKSRSENVVSSRGRKIERGKNKELMRKGKKIYRQQVSIL